MNSIDHRHPQLARHATATIALLQNHNLIGEAENLAQHMRNSKAGEHKDIITKWVSKTTGIPRHTINKEWDTNWVDTPGVGTLAELEDTHTEPWFTAIQAGIIHIETNHHFPLIHKFTNNQANRLGRQPEELLHAGWEGFCKALRRYNPECGALSTFTSYRVAGSLREVVRSESPVPKRLTTVVRRIESTEEELYLKLHRKPTRRELYYNLDTEAAKVLAIYPRLAPQEHLDAMESDKHTPAEDDIIHDVLRKEKITKVRDAINSLPEKESEAVTLTMLNGMTKKAAAARIGISTTELKKRETRAMEKLAAAEELRGLLVA